MQTTGTNYSSNQVIELREIKNGESTFAYYKANELEDLLFANPRIRTTETMEDGSEQLRIIYASDVRELYNTRDALRARLAKQEETIGKILDNLTADGWYASNVDKSDVLSALCDILDHEPKQTLNWTVTLTVSGSSEVDISEVNDFDIRYHLADSLSVDSNDFTTDVDSWDIDYVDSQDWQ